MSAEKVILLAESDLGYTESPPNSNMTKFGKWYGLNGYPWCVMALAYWFNKAGEAMAFFGGARTASCGTLLRFYREQGQTVPASQVQVGDIVILNFSGTTDTEHCGLVVAVHADGSITTIEGNTTPGLEGSQDNGGSVARKRRYPRNIVGVCRPQYTPDKPTDYDGHWAEEAIRWAMAQGIMQGYPDGSFKPDSPVTRAELATILRRMQK